MTAGRDRQFKRVNLMFNGAVICYERRPPRFLRAMIYGIFGFILGFVVCAAFCAKRIRELRQAFDASRGENEILRARELRYQETFVRLRNGVHDIGNDPSGRAKLPASAESFGQQPEGFGV